MNAENSHPHHEARESALKYLYQCEIEKIYFFNEPHFETFAETHGVSASTRGFVRQLVSGVLQRLTKVDTVLRRHSQNWSVERMPITDRSVMRLACYELAQAETPVKVVINEAIELAKRFGTEHSGSFVNGILDKIAKERDVLVAELG